MSVRAILRWPHPVLGRPAAPVGAITDAVRALWDDMIDSMEAMPGVGLAAPQIGEALRLAVVDASEVRGQAVRMADPVLVHASGTVERGAEASPNLPGLVVEILRPAAVTLRFTGPDGPEERRFDGLWARSALHQLDHLDGRVILERLTRTRRDIALRRWRKAAR